VGTSHDVAELVDDFADALIAVSPQGQIVFWSGGAERVFGYAKAEAIGRRLVELIVPAEQQDEESQRILTALEHGSATFEAVRRRKDGAPVHVDVTMKAVTNGEGRVTHVAISKKAVSLL
jgi:PAS domain S-box-containing protein